MKKGSGLISIGVMAEIILSIGYVLDVLGEDLVPYVVAMI